MPELTDYLNIETIQHLQDAFSSVSRVSIRICDGTGRPLTVPSSARVAGEPLVDPSVQEVSLADANAPVMLNDEVISLVKLETSQETAASDMLGRGLRLIGLVTGVIARLCQRERQLRTRVNELATLYRLTGEFTAYRDLQSVLNVVAKTVVETMGAKACAIRLISEDGKELLMKAVANLSQEYLAKGPVAIEDSKIDQEAMSQGEPVYIADLGNDPRVLYPQEAEREGIASGLCAPMIYHGKAEGAIRVYMAEVYEFDWFQVSLLKAIAAQAAEAIAIARLQEEALHAANVRRQLRLAGEVQRKMIPSEPPRVPGFDIAAAYVPCFELAGDFYDFISLPGGNTGVAVCDVVGKGVRASLLTASIRASLRAHASNVYEMSEVLGKVNRDLCCDTVGSDFATLFYGVLNVPERKLTYSNAGHVPPLLVRKGNVSSLDTGGVVLGIDPALSWPQDVVYLESGDVILIHTDGLNEAMNFEDEAFGLNRTRQATQEAVSVGTTAEDIVKGVLWRMRKFAGLQVRHDDLTLVAIKVI